MLSSKQKIGLGSLGILFLLFLIWLESEQLKIVDKRSQLLRSSHTHYKSRTLSQIRQIVVHHSASTGQQAKDYAQRHVLKNGWPGIGYHFVIEVTGMVVQTNSLTTICYGVENNNTPSIHICLSGDFRTQQPTTEQLKSLGKLIRYLRKQLPQTLAVTGHQDYKATSCPGKHLYKHLQQYHIA